jgi:hypothetical protein
VAGFEPTFLSFFSTTLVLFLGVCVQQSFVHPGDSQIAGEALQVSIL